MIVTVDGVALNVEEAGEGPPVVLLHGHALDLRVWDDVVPGLVGRGYRAIRYDQRGHGRSASPRAGYGWGDHVADLVGLVEQLGASPAHLVGLSKGGGIVLETALRRPDLVRSVAVVGPLVPGYPLSAELVESFRVLARAIRADGPDVALRRHWLDHPLLASSHALPGARERLEAMVLTFPAGEYFAHRDSETVAPAAASGLEAITAPTLVVAGERDVPDFRAMADAVAAGVPRARRADVAASGHLVPLEQPAALLALLLDFLAPR